MSDEQKEIIGFIKENYNTATLISKETSNPHQGITLSENISFMQVNKYMHPAKAIGIIQDEIERVQLITAEVEEFLSVDMKHSTEMYLKGLEFALNLLNKGD